MEGKEREERNYHITSCCEALERIIQCLERWATWCPLAFSTTHCGGIHTLSIGPHNGVWWRREFVLNNISSSPLMQP